MPKYPQIFGIPAFFMPALPQESLDQNRKRAFHDMLIALTVIM
jgi:hypothetical protein